MYNNAIIQTNYKPYVPLPKKKVQNGEWDNKSAQKQIVTPNNYSSPEQKKSSADTYTKGTVQSQKININQLLIDFGSTLNAIGASEDVEQEVKTYLGLVERQSQKDNPNKKMIISNLKIAADVLDGYISETLNKPSKVVKDWIDALLLQNIDFKADNNITKGAFEAITGEQPQTAKLAEKKLAMKKETIQNEIVEEEKNITSDVEVTSTEQKTSTELIPDEIEELIETAKEQKETSSSQALKTLSEAFTKAQQSQNQFAIAQIYAEIASIQNEENNLKQALECFNASTVLAYSLGDDNLKTKNHKQMGKIYDDAGYTDSALSHYFASIGIDGNLDDTDNQSDTLSSIGKMYSDKYNENEAVEYFKDALELAKVTSNLNLMSNIFIDTADTFAQTGKTNKALNNLKQAAVLSEKSGNSANLAIIYEQAGDLMKDMNFLQCAADLYRKSYRYAESLSDKTSLIRIREKLVN